MPRPARRGGRPGRAGARRVGRGPRGGGRRGHGPAGTDRHKTGRVGSSAILPGWVGVQAAERSAPPRSSREGGQRRQPRRPGRAALGRGGGPRNAAYLKVSTGIGAGLIVDGRLFHGSTGIAGEIGPHDRRRARPRLPLRQARLPGDAGRRGALVELLRPTPGPRGLDPGAAPRRRGRLGRHRVTRRRRPAHRPRAGHALRPAQPGADRGGRRAERRRRRAARPAARAGPPPRHPRDRARRGDRRPAVRFAPRPHARGRVGSTTKAKEGWGCWRSQHVSGVSQRVRCRWAPRSQP